MSVEGTWRELTNRTLANSLRGPFAPWPFRSSSGEREGHGAGLGSEWATERIGQGPIGRYAAGSEMLRERKGRECRIECVT